MEQNIRSHANSVKVVHRMYKEHVYNKYAKNMTMNPHVVFN